MADRWLATMGHRARRAWRWLVGDSWKRSLARLAVVLVVIGIAAMAFVSAGLVPVAASKGHWPITRVLLHYAMIRSVQTHAIAVKPPKDPALGGEAMVLKGAGHYASGCLACHGAPGRPRADVVLGITPKPPYLPPKIDQWSDKELFWIVRHGIKYTAMPAWPSGQRDDEAWAMVAFLRRLPHLSAAQFEQLAYGDSAALATAPRGLGAFENGATGGAPPREGNGADRALSATVADCARCHGADGRGRGTGAFPALAGQNERYLLASLRAYARGERHSGVMEPVAKGLDDGVMRALAGYYAGLRGGAVAAEAAPTPRGTGVAAGAVVDAVGHPAEPDERAGSAERGERLARSGDAARRVPSCVECHGPGDGERNPMYPRLAGQHPDYLALQLKLFQEDRRGGTPYAHIMETVAASLEPEDIRDIAAWYGSLPPEAGDPPPL